MANHGIFSLVADQMRTEEMKKKSPDLGEPKPRLVKMIYANPKSKDLRIRQGVEVEIDQEQMRHLWSDEGNGTITMEAHLHAPNWTSHGGWLQKRLLRRVDEVNEFGPVSP